MPNASVIAWLKALIRSSHRLLPSREELSEQGSTYAASPRQCRAAVLSRGYFEEARHFWTEVSRIQNQSCLHVQGDNDGLTVLFVDTMFRCLPDSAWAAENLAEYTQSVL